MKKINMKIKKWLSNDSYKRTNEYCNGRKNGASKLLFSNSVVISTIAISIIAIIILIVSISMPYKNKVSYKGVPPVQIEELYRQYLSAYQHDPKNGVDCNVPEGLKELKPIYVDCLDLSSQATDYSNNTIVLLEQHFASNPFKYTPQSAVIYPCIIKTSGMKHDVKITPYVGSYYIGNQEVTLKGITPFLSPTFDDTKTVTGLYIQDKDPIITSFQQFDYSTRLFLFLKVEVNEGIEVKYNYTKALNYINYYMAGENNGN